MKNYSRRDFLKIGGLALAGLAFTTFLPEFTEFEDMDLVRVAKDPVSVYKEASDKSMIVHTWVRDNLVHVYESIQVPTTGNTSLWYRVFRRIYECRAPAAGARPLQCSAFQHTGRHQTPIRGDRSLYRCIPL